MVELGVFGLQKRLSSVYGDVERDPVPRWAVAVWVCYDTVLPEPFIDKHKGCLRWSGELVDLFGVEILAISMMRRV
jgi:hypothetical protein